MVENRKDWGNSNNRLPFLAFVSSLYGLVCGFSVCFTLTATVACFCAQVASCFVFIVVRLTDKIKV